MILFGKVRKGKKRLFCTQACYRFQSLCVLCVCPGEGMCVCVCVCLGGGVVDSKRLWLGDATFSARTSAEPAEGKSGAERRFFGNP